MTQDRLWYLKMGNQFFQWTDLVLTLECLKLKKKNFKNELNFFIIYESSFNNTNKIYSQIYILLLCHMILSI